MLLAIDVGNTNTVLALFEGEPASAVEQWRCETASLGELDLLSLCARAKGNVDVGAIAGKGEQASVKGIIISSVVPQVNDELAKNCTQAFGLKPVFVNKDNVGIDIMLKQPEDVGADRLVNAVAVCEHYQSPAIVVDFGTATTFDVINDAGMYAGGVIAPGINLSLSALEQAAAKLPDIDIRKPAHVIGSDTISAMQSGIYYGYKGLIEGIVSGVIKEMNAKPFVLATGGLARLFAEEMPIINHVDQDLTMKGLVCIYKSQTG